MTQPANIGEEREREKIRSKNVLPMGCQERDYVGMEVGFIDWRVFILLTQLRSLFSGRSEGFHPSRDEDMPEDGEEFHPSNDVVCLPSCFLS